MLRVVSCLHTLAPRTAQPPGISVGPRGRRRPCSWRGRETSHSVFPSQEMREPLGPPAPPLYTAPAGADSGPRFFAQRQHHLLFFCDPSVLGLTPALCAAENPLLRACPLLEGLGHRYTVPTDCAA